jgi:EamA domain-containing membrane protein RarD
MSPERWLAFVGVWVALAVFTADALRAARGRGLDPAADGL